MVPLVRSASDITGCETEPIRFPAAVQPHGALLVVDPATGAVIAASASCGAVLGVEAGALLGRPLRGLLGDETALALLADEPDEPVPTRPLRLRERPLVARAQLNERGLVLVDVEDAGSDGLQAERGFRHALGRLRQLSGIAAIADAACRALRRGMGFDRVMVYRFDADWHGEVVGEAHVGTLDPFLGLHFPASDIPPQARELYRLCRVRQIPDIGYTPAALLGLPEAGRIDLGLSGLRSVSPVHIEYCRNMGVQATLVGSLMIDQRLWGLVACHHHAGPRYCGPDLREAFAGFCEVLAGLIDADQLRLDKQRLHDLALRRRALVATIRAHDFRALIRRREGQELLDVVGADGFALFVNGSTELFGHTPDSRQVRALEARRQAKAPGAALFSTDALERDLGPGAAAGEVAGALFVSVPHKPMVTMIWFRDEQAHQVRWCGDPNHPHLLQADGRISPRQSFAQFLQEVRGQALPWKAEELASAAELGALIEIDALREREAFTKSILDSSPEHLCVLDRDGSIVSVNRAWQHFALANGATAAVAAPLGMNYRGVCVAAVGGANGAEADAAWRGIADVLEGRSDYFSLDYPCDSPGERRWFQMGVYPLQAPCEGAVVLHTDITPRKLAELAFAVSEQRYRDVLEAQTDLICRFKADGTILYVNPVFCAFFDQTADALIGHAWQPVVLAEDLPLIEAALARVSADNPVVTLENRVHARGGEVRWGQFVNRGFFDDSGRLIEFQVVARDITERKSAEAELDRYRQNLEQLVAVRTQALQQAKDSAEASMAGLQQAHAAIVLGKSTLDAALESMSDAVFISDTAGRFVDFNEAFASFHHFKDKASCAQTLAEYPELVDVFLPNGDKVALENWAVPRALRGESASNAEFTLRRRDGGESWIGSYNYAPIRGQDGSIVGAVVTARDVTRLKQEAMALTQAKEAAEAANRAKSTFLATMSHELRTPLNGILGMIELAGRRASDARQIEQLGKAAKASRHLLEIIRDVLDISRIEANRFVLQEAEFGVDGVLRNLDAMVQQQIGSKALVLSMELAPELSGMVLHGDARRLSQVLLNLTGNAVKFTAEGWIIVRADLVEQGPSEVVLRFEIEDTGIGIEPQHQQRIFEAFEQADGSTTRAYGGSGLGLAISRRLVSMMGGSIGVDSRPGAGATFWFTVRMGRSQQAPAPVAVARPPSARALLQAGHAGASVLVVDDDALNLEVTQGLLEDCGLIVHTAATGAQAVQQALRVNYDLILMDLQLPVMDGIEATRRIRLASNNPAVPIIAFTANVFAEDEARCAEAGMDGFIGRPIESEALYTALLAGLAQAQVH